MPVTISRECPDTADAQALIGEIEHDVASAYPRASRHGLSPAQLIAEGVVFFVLRVDDMPAGCCGIKLCGHEYGELKRLFVRPHFRGQGLGKMMVCHLEAYALERGFTVFRLQTGIYQHEAMRLYERLGYRPIPPFGPYVEDPLNRFYEKRAIR